MAGTKISALPAASALGGTEAIPGVQGGINVKLTPAQIKTFVSASPTLVTPALGVATATSVASGSFTGGSVEAAGNSIVGFVGRSRWTSSGDGITTLYTNGFGVPLRMNFGGDTNAQSSFQFSGVDIKAGLADGSAGGRWFTTGGVVRKVRVVTAAGAVTVATTDDVVSVNKTSGAATTVNLPATPTTGQTYVIKDGKGDAATNNITVTPAAGNIDGAATYVLSGNYQAVTLTYTGSEWSVI